MVDACIHGYIQGQAESGSEQPDLTVGIHVHCRELDWITFKGSFPTKDTPKPLLSGLELGQPRKHRLQCDATAPSPPVPPRPPCSDRGTTPAAPLADRAENGRPAGRSRSRYGHRFTPPLFPAAPRRPGRSRQLIGAGFHGDCGGGRGVVCGDARENGGGERWRRDGGAGAEALTLRLGGEGRPAEADCNHLCSILFWDQHLWGYISTAIDGKKLKRETKVNPAKMSRTVELWKPTRNIALQGRSCWLKFLYIVDSQISFPHKQQQ
ncbi:uncharacterized protein LOC121106592 [Gallus gallus]|uniref:uncharacterized protein LOC121106592 n=1 Tax=Gallus gallus TaxID=9031 RepID=UPI001EFFB75D|nr:uncharacterized protein LOC121106592 [Gallus gallus]